ncbi:MAG: hypothetical protein Q4D21_10605, partial [Phascolarctobacterium sp.]|nr:hypothetical protein [Phascolarctobacterium sp.]
PWGQVYLLMGVNINYKSTYISAPIESCLRNARNIFAKLPQEEKDVAYSLKGVEALAFKLLITDAMKTTVKNSSSITKSFNTARIDIKLNGITVGKDSMQIAAISDKNANFNTSEWLNKEGKSYVIKTAEKKLVTTFNCSADGKFTIALRGNDIRDDTGKRLPVWIEYTSLKVDGKEILQAPTPTWHDRPFRYEMPVKDGQQVKLEVEWRPYTDASDNSDSLKKQIAELKQAKNIDETERYALKKQLHNVKSGWSFRIGRVITWLPRKLLGRKW